MYLLFTPDSIAVYFVLYNAIVFFVNTEAICIVLYPMHLFTVAVQYTTWAHVFPFCIRPIPKPRTRRGTFGLGRKTPLDYESVQAWLEGIKMDRYLPNFQSQGLKSIQDVLLLTEEEDIRGMGVTIPGHVNKIMTSVRGAHQQMQRESSMRV